MRDHKSLLAWVEAREVARAALDLSTRHWQPNLCAVFDQLTRAALAVQLNIAEGHGLGTTRQFVRHLRIAHGSAVEVGDLFEHLAERCPVAVATIRLTQDRNRRCCHLLLGLIRKYQTW
jgi:four helix bundle protein